MGYYSKLTDQQLTDDIKERTSVCYDLIEEFLKRKHLYIPGKWFFNSIKRKDPFIKEVMPRIDKNDNIFKKETVTLQMVLYGSYENILEFLKYPFSNVFEKFTHSFDYIYKRNGILYAVLKNNFITSSEQRRLIEYLLQNYPELDPSEYLNNPFSLTLFLYQRICFRTGFDQERINYVSIMTTLLKDSRETLTIMENHNYCDEERIVDYDNSVGRFRTKYDDWESRFHAFIQVCAHDNDGELAKLCYTKVFDPAIYNSFALRVAAAYGREKTVRMLLNDPRIDPSAVGCQALHNAVEGGHHNIAALLMSDPRVNVTIPKIKTVNRNKYYYHYPPKHTLLCGAIQPYYHLNMVKILLRHPNIRAEPNYEALRCVVVQFAEEDEEGKKFNLYCANSIMRLLILRSNKKLMGYVYKELWCYCELRDVVTELQKEMIVRIQRWYHNQIKYCPGNSGFRAARESFGKMISLQGR